MTATQAEEEVVPASTYKALSDQVRELQRHAGGVENRRHDGKIAVMRSNLRWGSDGFEIACDNAGKVRVAFALDCCDQEALGRVATTEGVKGEDIRDLRVGAVEYRLGSVNRRPSPIEWLSDNGSGDSIGDTKQFARKIGLEPLTTPVPSVERHGRSLRAHPQTR